MRRGIGVLSGVLDSGFAAFGNFIVGLYAVGTLPSDRLALYSLFFSGWIVAQLLPAQTAYLPARLTVNALEEVKAPNVGLDIRRNWLVVSFAPIAVALAGLPLVGQIGGRDYLSAAIAVAALTVVAPVQDHIRASLHVVNMHAAAAATSTTTAGTAAIGLLLAHLLGINANHPGVWVPFAVLVLANGAGATVGNRLLARAHRANYDSHSRAARLGYLGPTLIAQSNVYVANVVTAAMLGTSALASLETARVMTSPILVVVAGLATYISPTTVRSFVRGQISRFRRRLIVMVAAIVAVGALYASLLLIFADLATDVFGRHTDVPLSAARTLATSIETSSTNSGTILFTAGRPLVWNVVAAGCAVVSLVALVPSILLIGVLGVPLAQGLAAVVKTSAGVTLALRSHPRAP